MVRLANKDFKIQLHDNLVVPVRIHEFVAQGRRIQYGSGQRDTHCILCHPSGGVVARCDLSSDIPVVGNIFPRDGWCLVLNTLHDRLEHPQAVEVGYTSSQSKLYEANGRTGGRFFAWYLFGVSACASPILYSTVNSIVKDDSEERAIIMVSPQDRTYADPTARSKY